MSPLPPHVCVSLHAASQTAPAIHATPVVRVAHLCCNHFTLSLEPQQWPNEPTHTWPQGNGGSINPWDRVLEVCFSRQSRHCLALDGYLQDVCRVVRESSRLDSYRKTLLKASDYCIYTGRFEHLYIKSSQPLGHFKTFAHSVERWIPGRWSLVGYVCTPLFVCYTADDYRNTSTMTRPASAADNAALLMRHICFDVTCPALFST